LQLWTGRLTRLEEAEAAAVAGDDDGRKLLATRQVRHCNREMPAVVVIGAR
jgi:hypothetical protein